MRKHAILSASGASKWIACTPSAQLEAKEADSTSSYADEGTLAHDLGELLILHKLSRILTKEYKRRLTVIKANEYYSAEMLDHCQDYAAYVIKRFNEVQQLYPGAELLTEANIDTSEWIPEGFGRVDNFIIADSYCEVIDLKYGKGVPVDAEENKQLQVYALGGYSELAYLYKFSDIVLTIYQPRLDNINSWETNIHELLDWANEVVRPAAKLAWKGVGEFVTGDHCRFCKIKHKCKAFADEQLKLAEYAFCDVDNADIFLSKKDISDILLRASQFKNWIKSIEDYALKEAMKGKKWPGLKLVEGMGRRKYTNEVKIARILRAKGLTDLELFNTSLIGIGEMTRLLGDSDFNKLLSPYVEKPPGAPALVSEKDKRPEFSNFNNAKHAFQNINTDDL